MIIKILQLVHPLDFQHNLMMGKMMSRVQEEIATKQKESLSYQRELAANGSMLSQALDASKARRRRRLF